VENTNEEQGQLSSNDLGAIIGGCASGLVVIIIATVLVCVQKRKRKNRDFYAGRGLQPITAPVAAATAVVDDSKQKYPFAKGLHISYAILLLFILIFYAFLESST
jgi:hypothetical protein